MEQPTGTLDTTTWDGLDAAVQPTAPVAGDEPHASATARIGAVVGDLGGRLRSPSVTRRVAEADAVGRALQRAGGYFGRHGLEDIRNDAERLIVRRPLLSAFLAVVAGYLAGRAVWR